MDNESVERAVGALLTALGYGPPHFAEFDRTVTRVRRLFTEELLAGCATDPASVLSNPLPADPKGCEWIVLEQVQAVTLCPHHLMPAVGTVSLGYVPRDSMVSFGALHRLVRAATRRLILQEESAQTIVDALTGALGAQAAACTIRMAPTCFSAAHADGCQAVATASAFVSTDLSRWSFRDFLLLCTNSAGHARA